MGGGGSSNSNTTANKTDITTITNVENIMDIDLEPLGRVLADSQKYTAKAISDSQRLTSQVIFDSNMILADSQIQASKTEKEAAAIMLVNSELDRQTKEKALNQLDTYLEHAKNGLVISVAAAALIYYAKKRR